MDPKFLEFWGNALLGAARGEKQLGDVTRWFSQGFKGAEELTRQFAGLYGLTPGSDEKTPDSADWRQASDSFRQSFRQFLDMLEVVPRSEHQELVEKYEALREKSERQEQAIDRLEKLLAEKVTGSEAVNGFQELMQEQSKQFQDLMAAFTGKKS
jgi:serine phosphatase RsbU (regulator of sigma subunit)